MYYDEDRVPFEEPDKVKAKAKVNENEGTDPSNPAYTEQTDQISS